MKRIIIACLSTVILVFAGVGIALAASTPEIDSAGLTLTMRPTDNLKTYMCASDGQEMISGVETPEPYETIAGIAGAGGIWKGSSVDSMPTDTPYKLTGPFKISNLAWTINLNPAQPHGNLYTGFLTGNVQLNGATTLTGMPATLTGKISLITQGTLNVAGAPVTFPADARGWMTLTPTTPAGPGEYFFNVAFKIQSSYSATGISGNTSYNFDPWAVYDNGTCLNQG